MLLSCHESAYEQLIGSLVCFLLLLFDAGWQNLTTLAKKIGLLWIEAAEARVLLGSLLPGFASWIDKRTHVRACQWGGALNENPRRRGIGEFLDDERRL